MTPEERAYTAIRARILDLRLRPGTTVPEVVLAAELGISRPLLHVALLRLHTEGLVEPAGRRGYRVTVPSVEALREIYEIVGALEGQAVRRIVREAGPILLAALQTAVEEQDRALAAQDMAAWGRADRRFHELLREGANNARLRQLFVHYEGQLQQARAATLHLRAHPTRSTDDHAQILAAILAGDEEAASRAHAAHRRQADAEMLAAIEQLAGLSGSSSGQPAPPASKAAAPTLSLDTAAARAPDAQPEGQPDAAPVVVPEARSEAKSDSPPGTVPDEGPREPSVTRAGRSLWRRFSAAGGEAGGS